MELKIRNVNKIKSADIQLNGLTVIVGENDSGKSTIGRVLFSAIKALVNTKASKIQKQEELLDKHVQSLYRRLSSTGYGGFSVATKRNVSPIPRNAYEFISELKKNNSIDEYIKGVSFFIENLEATPRMKSLMKEDLHLIGICMKEKDNRAANLFAEFRFLLESEFLNQFGSNNNVSILLCYQNENFRENLSSIPIIITTNKALEKNIKQAIEQINKLPFITKNATIIRIEDKL